MVDDSGVKGLCLESLVAALFAASGWFVETNVLALKGPIKRPVFELDVWGTKWNNDFTEVWKFISCKNVASTAILKRACEEVHSHVFMKYPDQKANRVAISAYLAFSKLVAKDTSLYESFDLVSPVNLNMAQMLSGFTRFDEESPQEALVTLYLLFFLIVKYAEEQSVTLRRMRRARQTSLELSQLAQYKYEIKKSLAWELDPRQRFYRLFQWYQADPRLIQNLTDEIRRETGCSAKEAKRDWNVQYAYYLGVRNKVMSVVSAVRKAFGMGWGMPVNIPPNNNKLATRLRAWKQDLIDKVESPSRLPGQLQFLFSILGGTVCDNSIDREILGRFQNTTVKSMHEAVDQFSKLFPRKGNKGWFLSPRDPDKKRKSYMLRPEFMKDFGQFARLYLCLAMKMEPEPYLWDYAQGSVALIREIDREWDIISSFSLDRDSALNTIFEKSEGDDQE
jgi:hypothetical protein